MASGIFGIEPNSFYCEIYIFKETFVLTTIHTHDILRSDISHVDISRGDIQMDIEVIKKMYLPMSETAYYILLSLTEPCHGYGIILKVKEITEGRICIGAGTIYGTLSKFESDKLIEAFGEHDRKKIYKMTVIGKQILKFEYTRLLMLCENSKLIMEGL